MQADPVALSKCKSTVEKLNQGLPGQIQPVLAAVLEHRVTSLVSLTTWPTSVSFIVLKPSLMTAKAIWNRKIWFYHTG